MTPLSVIEAVVGLLLVATACAVITRQRYRSSRVLLGVAAASFAAGLIGVVDGLAG